MTNPEDFPPTPPLTGLGNDREEPKPVLDSAKPGSMLDREARSLLARLENDTNLPRAIRERAGRALRGDGTLRDVLATPEFVEIQAVAARQFREELDAMSAEEREEMTRDLRERFSNPLWMPGSGPNA